MAASIKSGELSAADSESTGDREVEGMRMGYLPDTMKEDLAENTVSFHLSVLLSSLSTHCCEQVMNPPSWLLVFIFCLHHSQFHLLRQQVTYRIFAVHYIPNFKCQLQSTHPNK